MESRGEFEPLLSPNLVLKGHEAGLPANSMITNATVHAIRIHNLMQIAVRAAVSPALISGDQLQVQVLRPGARQTGRDCQTALRRLEGPVASATSQRTAIPEGSWQTCDKHRLNAADSLVATP